MSLDDRMEMYMQTNSIIRRHLYYVAIANKTEYQLSSLIPESKTMLP